MSVRRIRPSRQEISVSYGGALPGKDEIVHGGRVKLTFLAERFPDRPKSFNILYLVSSAQPRFAVEKVRWAKRQGVRFLWNQNGVAYPAWAGTNSHDTNDAMRELMSLADFVIFQSRFCKTSAEQFLGPTHVPAEILYNGVDLTHFRPHPSRIPDSPWTLLLMGSHQDKGRVESALRALASLQVRGIDAVLVICGRIDWPGGKRQLNEMIDTFGVRSQVRLLPPYTQAEASAIYASAHLLIHTKYKDPCPTVVIEAMACGLPVIGSRSGGMPELVGGEGGILHNVPDSWDRMITPDPEDIADSVVTIMSNLDRWRSGARQRAKTLFDKVSWLDRHEQIMRSLLERP